MGLFGLTKSYKLQRYCSWDSIAQVGTIMVADTWYLWYPATLLEDRSLCCLRQWRLLFVKSYPIRTSLRIQFSPSIISYLHKCPLNVSSRLHFKLFLQKYN